MILEQGSALGATTGWAQGMLLGSLATTLAILAVALIGMSLLSGRIRTKRAIAVIVGCFIIFAAPVIANGVRSAANMPEQMPSQESPQPVYTPAVVKAVPYDPYAGATVAPGTRISSDPLMIR